MKVTIPMLALLLACPGLQAQPAPAATPVPATTPPARVIKRVDVFVTDATPVAAGPEAVALSTQGILELWNLDDMERLNAKLGAGLPRDQQAAVRIVAERATSLSAQDQALLSRAANGQARAEALKLDRVPAVVINDAHVYYGGRTIEASLDAFRGGK